MFNVDLEKWMLCFHSDEVERELTQDDHALTQLTVVAVLSSGQAVLPAVQADGRRAEHELTHKWCNQGKEESGAAQSCLTCYDPMDCTLPGSSVQGIL